MIKACQSFFDLPTEEKRDYAGKKFVDPIRWGTSFNTKVDKTYFWRDNLKVHVHPQFNAPQKPVGFRYIMNYLTNHGSLITDSVFIYLFYLQWDSWGILQTKSRVSEWIAERDLSKLGIGRKLHTEDFECWIKFSSATSHKFLPGLSTARARDGASPSFRSWSLDHYHAERPWRSASSTWWQMGSCKSPARLFRCQRRRSTGGNHIKITANWNNQPASSTSS